MKRVLVVFSLTLILSCQSNKVDYDINLIRFINNFEKYESDFHRFERLIKNTSLDLKQNYRVGKGRKNGNIYIQPYRGHSRPFNDPKTASRMNKIFTELNIWLNEVECSRLAWFQINRSKTNTKQTILFFSDVDVTKSIEVIALDNTNHTTLQNLTENQCIQLNKHWYLTRKSEDKLNKILKACP